MTGPLVDSSSKCRYGSYSLFKKGLFLAQKGPFIPSMTKSAKSFQMSKILPICTYITKEIDFNKKTRKCGTKGLDLAEHIAGTCRLPPEK